MTSVPAVISVGLTPNYDKHPDDQTYSPWWILLAFVIPWILIGVVIGFERIQQGDRFGFWSLLATPFHWIAQVLQIGVTGSVKVTQTVTEGVFLPAQSFTDSVTKPITQSSLLGAQIPPVAPIYQPVGVPVGFV